MEPEILFEERQLVATWIWVGCLCVFVFLPLVVDLSIHATSTKIWHDMLPGLILFVLLMGMLGAMRTRVNSEQIILTFGLFRLIRKRIPLNRITRVQQREYIDGFEKDPSMTRYKGRSYSMRMINDGVELELRRISDETPSAGSSPSPPVLAYIGSLRPEELRKVIHEQIHR